MTTKPISLPAQDAPAADEFQTDLTLTIAGGHFFHDIYTAFLAPLLPVLTEKLALSLTLAGSLNAVMQVPGLLNPLIGYMADRTNMRYFVILAPAITATLMSSLGFADSYFTLAALLFVTGISVAVFHSPAPAIIAHVSGRRVGLGMSLFMAAGEMARTIGPLIAVWAFGLWGLEGMYRVAVLGWGVTLVLFWKLRNLQARSGRRGSIRAAFPLLKSFFGPLAVITLFQSFMLVCLTLYLPTFMTQQGATLWIGGLTLSVLELAGVGGALASGTLSDRFGRKPVLMAASLSSTVLMLLFLAARGWLLIPILLGLGFSSLSTTPVILAMVQDRLPNNRAAGNGLYMALNFVLKTAAMLLVGLVGDNFGLTTAFFGSALLTLAVIPGILALPGEEKSALAE